MSDRILSNFSQDLSKKAVKQLEELGVHVRTRTRMTGIDAGGSPGRRVYSRPLWSCEGAGGRATPLVQRLGVSFDRGGRLIVEPTARSLVTWRPSRLATRQLSCTRAGSRPGPQPRRDTAGALRGATIVRAVRDSRAMRRSVTWTRQYGDNRRSRAIAEMAGSS